MLLKNIFPMALAMLAFPSLAAAQSPFGDAAPVQDAELAEQRGGFVLPGGIDIGIAITQETSINGQLLFRTSYRIDDTGPVISVDRVGDGISVTTTGDPTRTQLSVEVPGTAVSHLIGRTTGSVIANTANDRTIDTITTIDLDLSNMTVGSVGSLFPRLGSIARQTADFSFD
ncbi:hypothetical protein [Erythrobacter sp. F6033]|uniref:hypothetical protein n=1 Tax=Erythrobacter sp. F6033 TaxID=2926401 RepID=UPI001FF2878B|nr:hypothetical protein [Erythrobacter sp. F6033]MCK0127366.1 hypothetical protein [Erythrobacter sp. F6033]